MSMGFYVSVSSPKRGVPHGPGVGLLLLGPYERPEDAAANVTRARALAVEADPWARENVYGTSQVDADADRLPAGNLNRLLGLWPCAMCDNHVPHGNCVHTNNVRVGAMADRSA